MTFHNFCHWEAKEHLPIIYCDLCNWRLQIRVPVFSSSVFPHVVGLPSTRVPIAEIYKHGFCCFSLHLWSGKWSASNGIHISRHITDSLQTVEWLPLRVRSQEENQMGISCALSPHKNGGIWFKKRQKVSENNPRIHFGGKTLWGKFSVTSLLYDNKSGCLQGVIIILPTIKLIWILALFHVMAVNRQLATTTTSIL